MCGLALSVDHGVAGDGRGLVQLGLGLEDPLLGPVAFDNVVDTGASLGDLGLDGLDGMEHNSLLDYRFGLIIPHEIHAKKERRR